MTDFQNSWLVGQRAGGGSDFTASLDVSVVIPVYNERESLPHLVQQLHAALGPTGLMYELIFVDDGSTDESYSWLEHWAGGDPALTVIRFRRNFGQTAALQAGLDAARGAQIVTMDADLQNDPADIPRMLESLNEGHDLVAGWRVKRQDPFFSRRLPSMIANRIISMATKVKLHDYGCTLKAMTRDVAKELRLYGEMHRFIPAVASFMGVSILEVRVNHRARQFGTTKYGIGRTLRVVLDLMTVRFMQSYLTRPMQVFGLGGLVCFSMGSVTCLVLAAQKLLLGEPLAGRPLLLLGVLLIVVGLQLVSLGLVADIVSRTYHESQGKRTYHIRKLRVGGGTRGADRPLPAIESLGLAPTAAAVPVDAEGLPPWSVPSQADIPSPGTITAPPGAAFPEPAVTLGRSAIPEAAALPPGVPIPSDFTPAPVPVAAAALPPPASEASVLPPLAPPPAAPSRPSSSPQQENGPLLAALHPAVASAGHTPPPPARPSAPPPPVRSSAPPPPARGGARSAPPPPPRRS